MAVGSIGILRIGCIGILLTCCGFTLCSFTCKALSFLSLRSFLCFPLGSFLFGLFSFFFLLFFLFFFFETFFFFFILLVLLLFLKTLCFFFFEALSLLAGYALFLRFAFSRLVFVFIGFV